jgi:hypothetical protein
MRAKEFLEDISRRNLLKGAGAGAAGIGAGAQAKSYDNMDQLLQQKGLIPDTEKLDQMAMKFSSALDDLDDIGKIATGQIDPASLPKGSPANTNPTGVDTRTTGPEKTMQAKIGAVPTKDIKPIAKKPAPTVATKPHKRIVIQQAPGSVPWEHIAEYLKQQWKMDKAHIAGILANMHHESGFKPGTLVKDSNGLPSGGLFQHNGPRLQDLVASIGKSWQTNWQAQVDFAMKEPAGQKFRSSPFPDATMASMWWTNHFEKPFDPHKTVAKKRAQTTPSFTAP